MNFPFRYHLGEDAVEVKLGRWTARRIPYSNIEEVRDGHPFWNEHWTNIWPWRFLTLRLRRSAFKNFVINPADRAVFAQELRRKIGLSYQHVPEHVNNLGAGR